MAVLRDNTIAVILAAGKGTRMKSDMPKVAVGLAGKPMVLHVMDHLYEAGIRRMVLIVGHRKEVVTDIAMQRSHLALQFAEQAEQKGTAHAVLCAEKALEGFQGNLLVTCGDMPMIRPITFSALLDSHAHSSAAATVLASKLSNPTGYGRLVRNAAGFLEKIVEEKDATDAIRQIQEVNSGTYVFACPDIFPVLKKIKSENVQREYYLPDAIGILNAEGKKVGIHTLDDAEEALGVNSPEDLSHLESLLKEAV